MVCAVSSSASELSFSWDVPTLLGSEVVSYQVIVNRLEHRPGTREVIQSAVDEKFIKSLDARVTGLEYNYMYRRVLYKVLNNFTAAEVPYGVTVKALNLAGCGEESQTYCFTREGGIHKVEQLVNNIRDHKYHVKFIFHFQCPLLQRTLYL